LFELKEAQQENPDVGGLAEEAGHGQRGKKAETVDCHCGCG
jgi:hypothetical protein